MVVQTVLGPVAAHDLGRTLMHEHFVFGYPGFQGDVTLGKFDWEEALKTGIDVAKKLLEQGIQTVVDPTPNECGRNPELLREISLHTGLKIICATGYYFEAESATAYFKFRANFGDIEKEIYDLFMKEITEGIDGTGIKAGVIKLASSRDEITDYEKFFFRAAAKVQQETGVVIVTHTQEGKLGPEQADLLLVSGANPRRTMIGHMCGNTDIAYHLQTLAKGFYLGFDRFGLEGLVGAPTDEMRAAVVIGLIGLGYGNKLMLSQDTVNYWLGRPLNLPEPVQQILAKWNPTHLFNDILPLFRKAGITEEQIDTLFIDNPRQIFKG